LIGVAAGVLIPGLRVWVAGRLLVPALFGVAPLFGVATLVGIAAPLLGISALVGMARRGVSLLRRVAGLFWRISAARIWTALRLRPTAWLLLGARVAVVVVLIAGAPLARPAVARIVSHWCYSWFCAERLV